MALPSSQARPRVGVSLLTPFDDTGRVDEDALRLHLNRFADAGLEIWLGSSGTAEANVLSVEEYDRIVRIAVDEVGGRAVLLGMGIEPRSAADEIGWARRMVDLGVHGLQIGPLEPGHSYRPNDDDLRRFYDDVLGAVDVPCYIGSHMAVGYEVPPKVLVDVAADYEHVAGVVVCHLGNFPYLTRVVSALEGKQVILGSPFQALDGFACGATGLVSSMDATLAPHLYAALVDGWASGDLAQVTTAYRTAVNLFSRVLYGGGLVQLKATLDAMGLPGGPPRPPRCPASDDVRRRAEAIVADFGLGEP